MSNNPLPVSIVNAKLRVKKMHPEAKIPEYATAGSSGMDLFALEDINIDPGETKIVRTGIVLVVDQGYEIQVRPRSGMSLKTPLRVANSPGTVDSDYRGECCVIMTNTSMPVHSHVSVGDHIFFMGGSTYSIKKGDRIAQAVVCPVIRCEIEEVTDLDDTQRGTGGFGSTGR